MNKILKFLFKPRHSHVNIVFLLAWIAILSTFGFSWTSLGIIIVLTIIETILDQKFRDGKFFVLSKEDLKSGAENE